MHVMWCSSRSKLCLCWRFWLYASVYLSPPPRDTKSMNKNHCSCLNRVWRSFQKHSVILWAVVTSTRHRASVRRKAPGYSFCEVTALTAAGEYCGFSKNGRKCLRDHFWMSLYYLRKAYAALHASWNYKYVGVFISIHLAWSQRERQSL